MWLRLLLSAAALTCLVDQLAVGQDSIANLTGKEWQVKYDSSDVAHFPRSKRLVGDIRLHIYQDAMTGAYMADIRLFDKSHGFLAKADAFSLQVEGATNGRKRFGFWTQNPVDLSNGGKIAINGIWQHGLNTKDRAAQRIQLKWHYHAFAAAGRPKAIMSGSGGSCDDDPDSDVLEEGGAPDDDQQPPPDPTPPC